MSCKLAIQTLYWYPCSWPDLRSMHTHGTHVPLVSCHDGIQLCFCSGEEPARTLNVFHEIGSSYVSSGLCIPTKPTSGKLPSYSASMESSCYRCSGEQSPRTSKGFQGNWLNTLKLCFHPWNWPGLVRKIRKSFSLPLCSGLIFRLRNIHFNHEFRELCASFPFAQCCDPFGFTAANQDRCKSLQNSLCAEFQHGFDHHQIASNHGAQLWVFMVARWSKPYNPLCILQETCKRLQLGTAMNTSLQLGTAMNTSPYHGAPLICF